MMQVDFAILYANSVELIRQLVLDDFPAMHGQLEQAMPTMYYIYQLEDVCALTVTISL